MHSTQARLVKLVRCDEWQQSGSELQERRRERWQFCAGGLKSPCYRDGLEGPWIGVLQHAMLERRVNIGFHGMLYPQNRL